MERPSKHILVFRTLLSKIIAIFYSHDQAHNNSFATTPCINLLYHFGYYIRYMWGGCLQLQQFPRAFDRVKNLNFGSIERPVYFLLTVMKTLTFLFAKLCDRLFGNGVVVAQTWHTSNCYTFCMSLPNSR